MLLYLILFFVPFDIVFIICYLQSKDIQYSVSKQIKIQNTVILFYMKDITSRFLEVYNYLLESKKITNASDFAKKIGISTSLMSEIGEGRSNAGLKTLQKTVIEF